MGGGAWNVQQSAARQAAQRAAGQAVFQHTVNVAQGTAPALHDSLDPKIKAGPTSPHAGQVMRECMLSDEHPNVVPIVVAFDVTGSMIGIPRELQKHLGNLQGLLQRKGYVEHPEILFGAIGDARSDQAPLQVGQFESDTRMEDNLENVYLEGNGGGHGSETYDLMAYFVARHTYLEPFEKQGRKGYLFTMGDEEYVGSVRACLTSFRGHTLESLTGDTEVPDLTMEQLRDEIQERYHWFHLVIPSSYSVDYSLPQWKALLGERAIALEDHAAVAETIAVAIGIMEGTTTLDKASEDMKDIGADLSVIRSASTALAEVASMAPAAVATVEGDLTVADGGSAGVERL